MLLDINVAQVFSQILLFTVPALIVFLVSYLTIRKFLEEEYKKKLLEFKKASLGTIVPAKLQAYERLTILLERLKPDNLVLRTSSASLSATEYKVLLVSTIMEEYTHNVSQQIYVSNQAWKLIGGVKENIIQIVENSYKDMREGAKAIDLGRTILEEVVRRNDNSCDQAIGFLKKEIELVI